MEYKNMEGTVKFFNTVKGFGFITGSDGQDVFVHATQVLEGAKLSDGAKVTYEVVDSPKGKQAHQVALAK